MNLQEQPRVSWVRDMVPTEFRDLLLDDIEPRSPEQAECIKAVRGYVADILAGGRHPCVIYGPPGGGKTMLAAAAWNAVAHQIVLRRILSDTYQAGTADNVVWVRGDQLLSDYWKGAEQPDHRTRAERTYHIYTAGFAVIDDLDKHPAGNWAANLFGLIDARLVQYQLPTIITMNSTPADLVRKYGEHGDPMVNRMLRTGSVFVRLNPAKN